LPVSFLCLEHVEHWERIASRWRPAFSSHLINAQTGQVDTGTQVTGNPTYQESAKSEHSNQPVSRAFPHSFSPGRRLLTAWVIREESNSLTPESSVLPLRGISPPRNAFALKRVPSMLKRGVVVLDGKSAQGR